MTPPGVTHQATPAADTVIAGQITEETLLLREQLEAERAARRKVETDHASVQDEFQRYREATEARATPVPIRQAKEKRRFVFLPRRA